MSGSARSWRQLNATRTSDHASPLDPRWRAEWQDRAVEMLIEVALIFVDITSAKNVVEVLAALGETVG